MHSRYGLGVDWPLDYEDVRPYHADVKSETDVSGGADNPFAPSRETDFPMDAFPPSYSDTLFQEACDELGIRSEDIWTGATGENAIPATVEVVENAGSDNYLYLDIDGQECSVQAASDVKPDVGDAFRVTFDPSDIHVFDTQTGENLLVEETDVAVISDETPA
ncbi:TOBE domain-containing protein [Halopelagius fulvigenes]|uniref:TOBE domain-containing protein n=1 Tax=Halopelagius fulvigenes TaxID=1198324 RepID=A0ABD5TSK0_9EURY